MKKILLTLALLLGIGATQSAQAIGFDWGITGGLNMTKLKLSDEYKGILDGKNQAGWFAGLKANVGLIAGFGLDGAVVYNQRKFYLEGAEIGNYNLVSSYKTYRTIEIPINLKYSIGLGSMAAVYVSTGPQFGFNVGSRNWNIFSENYTGGDGLFRTSNMSTTWNVGAGVKVLSHLDVGVSYNMGLGKVGETALSNITGEQIETKDDYKANTFQVQMTYYF